MRKILFRLALIGAVGMLILGGTRVAAAEDHVVSDCGDTGLDTQLRFKLLLAQERDNLVVTFSCQGPVVLTGGELPEIFLNVTIDGGNTIVLSGNNATRLFEVASGGSLTLNNITLTKGYVDGYGGAIYSSGALTINNSKFLSNQTTLNGNGGAIIAFGALTINNSEFANNQAANGGAIYLSAGASVTIHASTLHANSARSGGGVYVYEVSSLTQLAIDQGSVLNANSATSIGGGIANREGDVTLTDVTLSGNTAESGGGIYSTNGLTKLAKVTLSGNEAGFSGGLFNTDGDATLTNVTLSGNEAGPAGGGVGGGVYNAPGDIQLTNVTLSGNSASVAGGIYHESGAGCPATDQRGVARTGPGAGIACDVGAIEHQAPLPRLYLPLITP